MRRSSTPRTGALSRGFRRHPGARRLGERGTEGKIKAAQFAREHKVPYLGICLGMQMAVIEAARNVAGVKTAGSEEFDHEAGKKRFEPVVYHLKEWVQGNYKVTRSASDDKAAPCGWRL